MTTSTARCGSLLALLLAAVPAAGLLAPDGTAPAGAAFPGANGKIAFSSDRAGDNEIFAMNPDGTGLDQLTSNNGDDYDPAWSADGGWIAFRGYEDGDAEIYARSCCGDVFVSRRLTNNTASDGQPAWSPDGKKIAFVTDRESGDAEIYVMDATDEKNNQTGTPGPDGNGDNQRNLTTFPAIDTDPAWSPDGTKIAFTTDRDSGNPEVYVVNASGGIPINLTNNPALDGDPNWSPDGTKIAFARTVDGNSDVWVMNADGSGQKRLTRKAADDYDPVWSPDGKKIAFETARGGDYLQIYVMKARPEGKRNRPKNLTRTDGAVENLYPDWRPIVN